MAGYRRVISAEADSAEALDYGWHSIFLVHGWPVQCSGPHPHSAVSLSHSFPSGRLLVAIDDSSVTWRAFSETSGGWPDHALDSSLF